MTTDATRDYFQAATQAERKAILRNEQRNAASTYRDHTHDDEGGRWAKRQMVSGSEPAVHMPRLPENSPQNQMAQMPPEPPYPEDIASAPVVGEYAEVQASVGSDSALLSAAEPAAHAPAAPSGVRGTADAVEPAAFPHPPTFPINCESEDGDEIQSKGESPGDVGRPSFHLRR